jgi:hypothetical protein
MTTTEGTDAMQVTLTIDSDTITEVIGELGRLAGLLEHQARQNTFYPTGEREYQQAVRVRQLIVALISALWEQPVRDPVAHYTAMADEARNESPRCDHCGKGVEPRVFAYREEASDHWSHKGGSWSCPEGTPTRDGYSSEVAEVGGSQKVLPA